MRSDHYEYKPRGKKPPTPRQLEMMAYIAEGRSRKEVAHLLGISLQTIKNHVNDPMPKGRGFIPDATPLDLA